MARGWSIWLEPNIGRLGTDVHIFTLDSALISSHVNIAFYRVVRVACSVSDGALNSFERNAGSIDSIFLDSGPGDNDVLIGDRSSVDLQVEEVVLAPVADSIGTVLANQVVSRG